MRSGWLLTFEWGGATYRFATEAVTVTDRLGVTRHYESGLDNLVIGKALGDLRRDEATIVLVSPTDWSAVERAARTPLNGHLGELRRYRAGDVLEDMPLYARGEFTSARWGEKGSPFELKLRRAALGRDVPMLAQEAFISADTIIPRTSPVAYELPEASHGHYYPLIIGRPEWVPARLTEWFAGDDACRAMAAAGRVAAGGVLWTNVTAGRETAALLAVAVDAFGRRYTYAGVTGAFGAAPHYDDVGDECYMHFTDPSSFGGGGILGPDGTEVLTVYDVFRWMMSRLQWSAWDPAMMLGARRILDSVRIGAWINDPDTLLFEWIEDEILPLIPGTWACSERGVYFRALDYTAPRHHALWTIDTSRRQGTRTGDPEVDTDDIANHLTLRFAPGQSGSPAKIARLSGDPVSATEDLQAVPSHPCFLSESEWGQRVWEMSTHVVREWGSAHAILRLHAAQRAKPKTRISYTVDEDWESAMVGDVVLVTDEEVGASARVGIIEDVWVGGLRPVVDVILLDEGGW